MDTRTFISLSAVCSLATVVASRQDGVCFTKTGPTAVLEGTDAVLMWSLTGKLDSNNLNVKLFRIDTTGKRHRLMVLLNGEVVIGTPAYDNRLDYNRSTGIPNSLSFILRNVKQADKGIYGIHVDGGPAVSLNKQCNMSLSVVNDSAIKYSIVLGGTSKYELSLVENGTDVLLSGDGDITVTRATFLIQHYTIYPEGRADDKKHTNRSTNAMTEQGFLKIAEMTFAVQNCPSICLWKARDLVHGAIGSCQRCGEASALNDLPSHDVLAPMLIGVIA